MHNRLASSVISVFLVAAFVLLVNTGVAHAYIEIGAAGLMIQFLLASAVAGLFAIKLFWRRITGSVARLFGRPKRPQETLK